jgi:hypothetical protein
MKENVFFQKSKHLNFFSSPCLPLIGLGWFYEGANGLLLAIYIYIDFVDKLVLEYVDKSHVYLSIVYI